MQKETPVALIHWGTYDKQQTVTGTLESIETIVQESNIANPSMIVVGDVVQTT